MDVEEPEAAMIISVSLYKKNEASMKTSHTEIMNTLVGLCAPSPNDVDGKVPFQACEGTYDRITLGIGGPSLCLPRA